MLLLVVKNDAGVILFTEDVENIEEAEYAISRWPDSYKTIEFHEKVKTKHYIKEEKRYKDYIYENGEILPT